MGTIVALIVGGVMFAFLLIIIFYVIGVYNKLVRLREQFVNSFAQIDVQLKRRYDLIPNLVETAKGYMAHERETLDAVISARNQAMKIEANLNGDPTDLQGLQALAGAEGALGGAMSRLMAVMEAYPELKADTQMQQIQEELTSTENKIAFARQAYNDGATTFNIYRKQFPPVVIGNVFGFVSEQGMLEATESEEEKQAPKVSF